MNFIAMQTRIATELRRANLVNEIKSAINDAIREAASTRFYFNEMRGQAVPTVIGQEYYDNPGLSEVDSYYYYDNTARTNLRVLNNLDADCRATGSLVQGQVTAVSIFGDQLRLDPIPNSVFTLYLDGYGRLAPFPLVEDGDTNKWMTEGEMFIRALAKRNIQRDVVKDYGDATVLDAVAEDFKTMLLDRTTGTIGTGRIRGTQF